MITYAFVVSLILSFQPVFSQTINSDILVTIPKQYAGHWQKGDFSLTNFEENSNKYIGPENEISLSYVIEKNGGAKEYFISNTNNNNCRTQILGYREGQILIDTAEKSFEFRPETGYYYILTCMSKTASKRPYSAKDLYPSYTVKCFLQNTEKGRIYLITKNTNGTERLRFQKID